MLLTMAVSLYTSRIVLNTLGVEDFGIYNVVGGFVTMFAFLNSAMASASQRFLAFEIGKGDRIQLRNVFSMSIIIHFLIAFIVLIFAETVGLWFVNTQLNIADERMVAARWVYQFSIFTLMVNMVSVPYNAMIIAHERMNVFAWVSIAEVSLKLLIVFMLQWFGFDKLKFYSILVFGVALLIRLIYGLYCSKEFRESKFFYYWHKPLFKTLINYAGWNLWGNAAGVIMGQGVNILLNIFFGPVVNAARGIAFQVKSVTNQFVLNFQMAINPQIIKSYAANDLEYMHQLIFQGAKYSYFLLFALSLPIILETEIILRLWLKIVPEYTVIFTRLVLINILIDSISGPLMTAAQASGKIKLYQGVVGGLLILNLPVSYLFLKLGFSPETTLYVSIGISIIALFSRLKIISPLVKLNLLNYLKKVVLNILPVSIIAIVFPVIIKSSLNDGIIRLIFTGFSSIIFVGLTVYLIGLGRDEQVFLNMKIKQVLTKIHNR
ncbi:MAG: lipopolysaccharide biosynthesis protein [Lentimicrobium sp.]